MSSKKTILLFVKMVYWESYNIFVNLKKVPFNYYFFSSPTIWKSYWVFLSTAWFTKSENSCAMPWRALTCTPAWGKLYPPPSWKTNFPQNNQTRFVSKFFLIFFYFKFLEDTYLILFIFSRTESSSMVLQPLIQRILRVFCTFKEIRNIFAEIRLADNLQALVDRQMANESKNRTGPGKSFRQSGFHAQILRLIQILKSWSKLAVSNHQKFIEIESFTSYVFYFFAKSWKFWWSERNCT